MVNALVSLLLPNLNTGAQAGAAGTGLLAANPFDGLGALNFSSFLDTAGKPLDPAKLPELLNTLKEEGGFDSLLQLPDAELPDFEKIDSIDQAITVAAVILPVIPTAPQPDVAPAEGTSLVESVGEVESGTTELKTDATLPLPSILQQLFKQASQVAEAAPVPATSDEEANPAIDALQKAIQELSAPYGIQKAENKKVDKADEVSEAVDATEDTDQYAPETIANKATAALTATVTPLIATDTDSAMTTTASAVVQTTAAATPLVADKPDATAEEDDAADPIDEKKVLLKTGVTSEDEAAAKKKVEKKDDKPVRADAAQPVITQQQQNDDPKLAKMHTDASLKISAADSDSSGGQQASSGDKQQQNAANTNSVQQNTNGLGQNDVRKPDDVDPTFMKMVRAGQGTHTPAPEQVLVNIKHAIHDQNDRIRIQLSPHELGSVDITLTLKGDEVTNIRILAEKSETLDMLRQDRGFLERSLQESGLKADAGGLQFGLKGDQSANAQFSQGQSNGNRKYQTFPGDEMGGGEEEVAPLAWQEIGGTDVLIASTGINIRV